MMWQTWANMLLGGVVIGVAFTSLTESSLVWTLSIIGAGIILIELWEAGRISELIKENVHNK